MLKMIYSILIFLLTLPAFCPEHRAINLSPGERICPFEAICGAVVQVESSGDNFAFNQKELSTGAFQIRPIRLQDYNQRTGNNYQLFDMFNYELSKEAFLFYCHLYGHHKTDQLVKSWNGRGRKADAYLKRVKNELSKLN